MPTRLTGMRRGYLKHVWKSCLPSMNWLVPLVFLSKRFTSVAVTGAHYPVLYISGRRMLRSRPPDSPTIRQLQAVGNLGLPLKNLFVAVDLPKRKK